MTMLDLAASQIQGLDHLVCVTCGSDMQPDTDGISCVSCGTHYPVDSDGIVRTITALPARMNPAVRMGQWSWVAAAYDAVWRTRAMTMLTGETFPVEREIDIVSDSIGLHHGRIFLDNASANGLYARKIARRLIDRGQDGIIFAVDISLPMLRKAKALAEEEGVSERIVFIHADAEHMPFRNGTFHGIMCGGSLNEFVSPNNVLRELRRLLDPRSGSLSLMFQIRSQKMTRSLGQRMLSNLLGLSVFGLRDSIEKVRTFFDPEIRFYGGMVLMLKCRSRVQFVTDDSETSFTEAVTV